MTPIMKTKLFYWIGLLCLININTSYAQQVTEEWAKRYNGTGSQNERVADMAVDTAGNVYVTGTSIISGFGLGTDSARITTVKYSPAGVLQWSRTYEVEQYTAASSIAIDHAGTVYVTGYTRVSEENHDYITIRYDAAEGAQRWVRHYDGPAGGIDEAIDIEADNMGGIYVTGNSDGGATGTDIATIRYNAATGAVVWVKRINTGSNNRDEVAALVLDNAGALYLTGTSVHASGAQYDIITARYHTANGNRSWLRTYSGQPGQEALAVDLAVDNTGGLYVTSRYDRAGTNADFLTIHYKAISGSRRWESFFNGASSGYDHPRAITVDNAGGVYVTGNRQDWSTGEADIVTIRYSAANGTQSWLAPFDNGNTDIAVDIAADNVGGIYVTGNSYNLETENLVFATILYAAATGHESWREFYITSDDGRNSTSTIAVDNTGSVYITGSLYNSKSGFDFATIRYDAADGTQRWVRLFDQAKASLFDQAIAVATDAAGNSYVTGTSTNLNTRFSFITTIKYSPAGDSLWVVKHDEAFSTSARAIAVDAAGGVYVTGTSRRGLVGPADYVTTDIVTIRYDATTGARSWIRYYEGGQVYDDSPSAIAVDNAGGLYVTGNSMFGDDGSDSPREYITIRYDANDGYQSWTASFVEEVYNGINYMYNVATAIAVDKMGGVYVTGSSNIRAGADIGNYLTIRYDAATGTERWRMRYDARTDSEDRPLAITVDITGGVYVTGTTATVRYYAADGTQRWAEPFPGTAIAADNMGAIYITGTATSRHEAATGSQTWTTPYPGTARAIAVDGLGGVYVSGTRYTEDDHTSGTFYTAKYSVADGALLWEIQTAGPEDVAVDMVLDSDHNVIVTGYTLNQGTGYDFLTIKYSQTSCPTLAGAYIQGSTKIPVRSNGSSYTLPASGATSFEWSITDGSGTTYTSFTGQGTNSIKVNWPSTPGVYKVSVAYGGGAGCPSLIAVTYVHVFDPGAGFVTGGGWYQSPANSAYEFMKSSTRATFGLMAKYKKGEDNQLQGNTQLRLESENLVFNGNSHESRTLVIAGNQAFYRGSGSVSYRNNVGQLVTDPRRFSFLVAATDGQLDRSRDRDKLRIMVWELNTDGTQGTVVYDNQAGCSTSLDENAAPCQVISGGNIVIHKPNLQSARNNALSAEETTPVNTELVAYPTTFDDRTTIAFSVQQETAYTLELFDLKGALVQRLASGTAETGQRYEHELSAAALPKGLYLVRLVTDDCQQTVRVIVER